MKTIPNEPHQASESNDQPRQTSDAQFNRARTAALNFLSYRARSEAEVRRRLESSHDGGVVHRVIEWLKGQRYLNDAEFAGEWRHHREARHPRGEVLIRQELSKMGVDREVVEAALEGFDAAENAYRAGQKPAARLKDAGYARFRQRLWAYLNRRGFEADVIGKTVQRLWDEQADPVTDSLTDPLTNPLNSHVDADPHAEQPEEQSDA